MALLGKWLMLGGALLAMCGALLWLLSAAGLPLGRLPGDITYSSRSFSFSFPLVTCIILSVILTVALNLLARWLGK